MGKPHPEEAPPISPPTPILYLFRWFHEMSHGRPVGGMGTLMPIPPTEIHAWARLSRIRLADWELAAIWALDAAFLRVIGEKL